MVCFQEEVLFIRRYRKELGADDEMAKIPQGKLRGAGFEPMSPDIPGFPLQNWESQTSPRGQVT